MKKIRFSAADRSLIISSCGQELWFIVTTFVHKLSYCVIFISGLRADHRQIHNTFFSCICLWGRQEAPLRRRSQNNHFLSWNPVAAATPVVLPLLSILSFSVGRRLFACISLQAVATLTAVTRSR